MIAPQTPIEDVPLAVVDVETTGLDPQAGDRVCEIAVLRVDPGEAPRLWVSLVNPERPIGAGAQAVNGIADEDVAAAPLFGTLIAEINAGLDGAVLVAHNVPFDVGFLRAEYRRAGRRFPTVPTLDTLELARRCFRFGRNGLGAVARQLGVSVRGLHRAEGDVWATYRVLQRMIEALREHDCRTLGDFLAAHRSCRSTGVWMRAIYRNRWRRPCAMGVPSLCATPGLAGPASGSSVRCWCRGSISSPTAICATTSAPFGSTALWRPGGRTGAN